MTPAALEFATHARAATALLLLALAWVAVFFALRPELWRSVFLARVDPRPAGLLRIGFGTVLLMNWINLLPHARFLFTDEGLWLTATARRSFSTKLAFLWDSEHGFEHAWNIFPALWGKFSILHLRSDPPFAFTILALMLASLISMILGFKTRWTTLATWLLMLQLYGYNPSFFYGGDHVMQAFLFLGVFTQWGQAYSVDTWLRRRRAILGSAHEPLPLAGIPAWPLRLMMLQLTIIYCATGVLKSGPAWHAGTALYYALNLDHFYRVPMSGLVGFAQYVGLLPLLTRVVRWWEMLFPLALLGAAINAYEDAVAWGRWQAVPRWRRVGSWLAAALAFFACSVVLGMAVFYSRFPQGRLPPFGIERAQVIPLVASGIVLLALAALAGYRIAKRHWPRGFHRARRWLGGKRTWLAVGVGMHAGIGLTMGIGAFAPVMIVIYAAWLSGREVDLLWRFVFSRPCRPAEGGRPARRWFRAPFDRLRFRKPGPTYLVRFHPDEQSIRRAALLRGWDAGGRLRFVERSSTPPGSLEIEIDDRGVLSGRAAASALTRIFPGLWWIWPSRLVPGLAGPGGALAARLLGQS